MKLYEQKLSLSISRGEVEIFSASFNLESMSLLNGIGNDRMSQPEMSLIVNKKVVLDFFNEPYRGQSPIIYIKFEEFQCYEKIIRKEILDCIPFEDENRSNMCRNLQGRRQDILESVNNFVLKEIKEKIKGVITEYSTEKKDLYHLDFDLDEYALKSFKLISHIIEKEKFKRPLS